MQIHTDSLTILSAKERTASYAVLFKVTYTQPHTERLSESIPRAFAGVLERSPGYHDGEHLRLRVRSKSHRHIHTHTHANKHTIENSHAHMKKQADMCSPSYTHGLTGDLTHAVNYPYCTPQPPPLSCNAEIRMQTSAGGRTPFRTSSRYR